MVGRRKNKNRWDSRKKLGWGKKKNRLWMRAAIALLLAGGICIWADAAIKPVLSDVAQVEVKEMMSVAINDAVKEKVWVEAAELEFLEIESGEDGVVSLINANTAYMNQFAAELTEMIHKKVEGLSAQDVGIPLGSLFGSELLAQTGPEIDLRIKPLGMAKVDFKTEFESSGINQTKYKVYLEVCSKVKPLIPFLSDPIEFSSVIPVAETVVVGKVPQTYIGFSGGANSGMITGESAVINGINLSQLEN